MSRPDGDAHSKIRRWIGAKSEKVENRCPRTVADPDPYLVMSLEADPVVQRYLAGDEDAFRDLVEAEAATLQARIGRRMAPLLRRRISIQDVWQEVCLVAFERRGTFVGRSRPEFGRWMAGIADLRVHQLVDRHRGAQKRGFDREVSRNDADASIHPECPSPSPSEFAMGAELAELAARAMMELPDDYREVLRLRRETGATLAEVAARMRRTHDATKKLHGRAMLRFAEIFERLRRGNDVGS